MTVGRYPDGESRWEALLPTPGSSNVLWERSVVITEIMYHPASTPENPGDNTRDEYIELRNVSGSTVELWTAAGPWRIDGGVAYTFPEDYSLAPGAYVVLVSFDSANAEQTAAFRDIYGLAGEPVELLGPYFGKLSNRGERIAAEKPEPPDVAGQSTVWVIVDEVIYFDAPPWPSGADGTGQPVNRTDSTAAGNDPRELVLWGRAQSGHAAGQDHPCQTGAGLILPGSVSRSVSKL